MAGKLENRALAVAGDFGLHESHLFYVLDRVTRQRSLVDTGAEVSVMPVSPSEKRQSSQTSPLRAINCSSIATYGQRSLTVDLGLRHMLQWIFIVADISIAILEADFLNHFNLSVDMHSRRLVDTTTRISIHGINSHYVVSEVRPAPPTLGFE